MQGTVSSITLQPPPWAPSPGALQSWRPPQPACAARPASAAPPSAPQMPPRRAEGPGPLHAHSQAQCNRREVQEQICSHDLPLIPVACMQRVVFPSSAVLSCTAPCVIGKCNRYRAALGSACKRSQCQRGRAEPVGNGQGGQDGRVLQHPGQGAACWQSAAVARLHAGVLLALQDAGWPWKQHSTSRAWAGRGPTQAPSCLQGLSQALRHQSSLHVKADQALDAGQMQRSCPPPGAAV